VPRIFAFNAGAWHASNRIIVLFGVRSNAEKSEPMLPETNLFVNKTRRVFAVGNGGLDSGN
jgi:hypothetical protein